MSKKSMNMILANWVHSKVCKQCRQEGANLGFAEHEGCSNHMVIVSWLLGGRVGLSELRRLRHWVRFRKDENGHWDAIGDKMQQEIARRNEKIRRGVARRKIVPEIKWQEIGVDNIDYWEKWQEANE